MARNKINDLRDHLFETLERLKDGDIDIATAKAMADVGQVLSIQQRLKLISSKQLDQQRIQDSFG